MEKFDFDQFEECRILNQNINCPVILLRDRKNGTLYVQKEIPADRREIYESLTNLSSKSDAGLPKIWGMMPIGDKLMVIEAYIDGKNLSEILRERQCLNEEACRLIIRLCEILKPLHHLEKPIIHRDIKPSNIILTSDGEVFLIDFESARFYHDAAAFDTDFLGTSGFAAPEHYGFAQSDTRTDIFALGVLLNFLLTGEFPGTKMTGPPFIEIVRKCTEMDPDDRFADVSELKEAMMTVSNIICGRQEGRKLKQRSQDEPLLKLNDHKDKPVLLVRNASKILVVQKKIESSLQPLYQELMLLSNDEKCFIPRIYEINQSKDDLWITEEYINGRTLADHLESGTISPEQTLRIMIRLCAILKRFHDHQPQIIHRDLKPSNIILTEKGEVWLIDFDAARFYAPGETKDTVQLGTVGFAPPEQFGFGQCDARSDLYALGVLMNVMLTGEHPKTQMAEAPFAAVVQKCTEMDREKRYVSVDDLRSVLATLYAPYEKIKIEPEKKEKPIVEKRSWLPPGFRSKTPWKMLLSVGLYLLILSAALSFIPQKDGVTLCLAVMIVLYWLIFLIGDYRGLSKQLPFLKKERGKLKRVLGIIFWTYAVFCGSLITLVLIEKLIETIF